MEGRITYWARFIRSIDTHMQGGWKVLYTPFIFFYYQYFDAVDDNEWL